MNIQPNVIDAIKSINTAAQVSVSGNDINNITWENGTVEIAIADIQTELDNLQAAYDAQAYARSRKAKYDLLNQDEMRYDDTKNSTTTWVDAIDAIKVAHPKP
jgi:hypothetical protein